MLGDKSIWVGYSDSGDCEHCHDLVETAPRESAEIGSSLRAELSAGELNAVD